MRKPQHENVEMTWDAARSSEPIASSRVRPVGTKTRAPLSRSPVAHPLFLAALFLLVLNDHFLKTSGLLPGAITGKLSDFAGLLVAPVLLTVLLRAKGDVARGACFALVALVFGAINVSPDAAALFERVTALIQMPWSVFVDPTDLIGLAVYPLAWRISRDGAPARSHRERLTVLLASIACAASSALETWSTGAYVVNRTERSVSVSIRWAEADLDCDAIAGRSAEVFGPGVFGEATTFELEKNRSLALEQRNAAPVFDEQGAATIRRCEAVLLQAGRLPPQVVFFSDRPLASVPGLIDEEDEDDLDFDVSGMLVVEENDDGELSLRAGEGLEMSASIDELPAPECSGRDGSRFGWSLFPASLEAELVDATVGGDGCLALDFALQRRLYLCIPPEELPFAPGDRLDVTSIDGAAGRALSMIRETEEERVELMLWSGRLEGAAIDAVPVDREACGHRLECGSYAVPVTLELPDGSRIAPGIAIEQSDGARLRRIVLGNAEHFLSGAPGCEPGSELAGYVADVLIVRSEVK